MILFHSVLYSILLAVGPLANAAPVLPEESNLQAIGPAALTAPLTAMVLVSRDCEGDACDHADDAFPDTNQHEEVNLSQHERGLDDDTPYSDDAHRTPDDDTTVSHHHDKRVFRKVFSSLRTGFRFTKEHPVGVGLAWFGGLGMAVPLSALQQALDELSGCTTGLSEDIKPGLRKVLLKFGADVEPLPPKEAGLVESDESMPEPRMIAYGITGPAAGGFISPSDLARVYSESVKQFRCQKWGRKDPLHAKEGAAIDKRKETLCAPAVFRAVVGDSAVDICLGHVETKAQCAALSKAVGFKPLATDDEATILLPTTLSALQASTALAKIDSLESTTTPASLEESIG